ncbi:hypothetical protein [Candidatus Mycoplasma haematohominis]|uniref:Uncharacterized protein n=1 Tax=Candidatus Mycoplasma haematohominis TaxID=1494318 RepID=A0A478FS45_9MOLU|nr:hypothetical protein [Candidatus Mycoplasma haemohominis]GCE63894.1 hypothetical protein MHSWG343_09010 [Candidatus Mycoplasma haemohominis]
MASPAAIGAGITGGAVAVAGTSYAAYTQLRPYDDFLDYANRNWYEYIGGDTEKISSKIVGTAGQASNPYKDALKRIRGSWKVGTGGTAIQDTDIDVAGKDGDSTSPKKIDLIKEAVKGWCEETKKNTPTKKDEKIDWSDESMKKDENWKNFADVCLEPPKKVS